MSDVPVLRLLELLIGKLGARDARLEIGGEPPTDPRLVFAAAGPNRRVVLVFEAPPSEPGALRAQLAAMVEAFHDSASPPATAIRPSVPPPETRAALDAELAAVCVSAGARCALLIDGSSPIVWGRSHELLPPTIEPLLEIGAAIDEGALRSAIGLGTPAGLATAIDDGEMAARVRRRLAEVGNDDDPAVLLLGARAGFLARALAEAEPQSVATLHCSEGKASGYPWTAHGMAVVYLLVLAFDDSFNELHAERAVRGNRTRIERLISALPPIDPTPGKARVVRLKPR